MCGICGFTGQGGPEDLVRMNESMIHRGPDGDGLWHDREKAVYLGHRRLAVLDLECGAQPMWTEDGALGVIFNGEIYNYIELREELTKAGHRFFTDHSDTEVLLHGYSEWGRDLPGKLNGMWAFAIYDRKRHELFISKDRFGKKPLFYSLRNGTFAFASELHALLKHPSMTSNLSVRNLKKYFAYGYVPAPHSIYQNIYKLPGGHNLIVKLDGHELCVEKYWDFVLEPFSTIPKNPEEEWGGRIRELLSRAVKRRLMSDVPLGIFLSGGIDSSSVAAYALEAVGRKRMKSFSIGFRDSSFDESVYAQRAASLLGSKHTQEVLSAEKCVDLLPEITSKLDEPLGDSSLLPTFLLCRLARKQVTVALGGDGADELFAGYDPFQVVKAAEWYKRLIPNPIHEGIRMLVGHLPVSHRNMSLDFRAKRFLRGLSYPEKLWNTVWLGPLEPSDLKELFEEPVDVEDIYEEAIQAWDACLQDNPIDKTLQFYTKLYLQNIILPKVDRTSMMLSLEVRSPYLDIDLVNFARRIPHFYKYRNGETKYILKKALEPLLPHDIVYRSKKGFGAPIGRWFRDGSLAFNSRMASKHMSLSFIHQRIAEHKANRQDHRAFLLNQWLLNHCTR